jgi:hypothetical protein
MSSTLMLSLLVPQSSKSFLLLRFLLHMNDTICTASCGHAWLMPTVSELLWSVSRFWWLSPAVDVLWKCDCRLQWLSPFSWVMACNNAARFCYHCVSGRLFYNITQVYAHVHLCAHAHAHTHTHTHTHTLCECGCLSLEASVATVLDSWLLISSWRNFAISEPGGPSLWSEGPNIDPNL